MQVPRTLQDAIQFFSDYENCRLFMVSIRYEDCKVLCPRCGAEKVTYLAKSRVYKCYGDHPKQKFSLKVGTVMEDSPIPLEKWLPAFWMLANDKNGISSYELSRAIGVTQKSAWFMLHRIRLALKTHAFGPQWKMGGEGGTVEADETYIGPNPQKMHRERAMRYRAAKPEGKTIVFGMLDRDSREVRAKVVPNAKRETLQNEILRHVKHGSSVFTDEAVAYDSLHSRYVHDVVKHAETYVSGQVHTNGIENFWSLLKRSLKGTYIAVEPFHLERYIDEQAFRFNYRGTKKNIITDADRFGIALSQIAHKRLTYAEVTGKVGETSN